MAGRVTRMAPGESSKLLGKDVGSGDWEHSWFFRHKGIGSNDRGFVSFC